MVSRRSGIGLVWVLTLASLGCSSKGTDDATQPSAGASSAGTRRRAELRKMSCAVPDDYGLCDCLVDRREGATKSCYCTMPCTDECPDGYECLEASQSPSSMGAATFCFAAL
jgi:hypothetical protein